MTDAPVIITIELRVPQSIRTRLDNGDRRALHFVYQHMADSLLDEIGPPIPALDPELMAVRFRRRSLRGRALTGVRLFVRCVVSALLITTSVAISLGILGFLGSWPQ